MTVVAVHNPSSRRGREVAERFRRRAGELEVEVQWIEIAALASASPPAERVVAIGGDGTVNAACDWLRRTGGAGPVAIVPAGTGNNLARGLAIPLEVDAAFDVALTSAATAPIDAILYRLAATGEERIAIQITALGFPAEVAERYDELRARPWFRRLAAPLGPYVYRLLALGAIRRQRRRERAGELARVTATFPEGSFEGTAAAVFAGNECSLGGNFIPCPRARLDDGRLDLCILRSGTEVGYLKLFGAVAKGEHLRYKDAVFYAQSTGPVTIATDRAGPLLSDGDLWLRGDAFELEVLPRAFAIVVPPVAKEPTTGTSRAEN